MLVAEESLPPSEHRFVDVLKEDVGRRTLPGYNSDRIMAKQLAQYGFSSWLNMNKVYKRVFVQKYDSKIQSIRAGAEVLDISVKTLNTEGSFEDVSFHLTDVVGRILPHLLSRFVLLVWQELLWARVEYLSQNTTNLPNFMVLHGLFDMLCFGSEHEFCTLMSTIIKTEVPHVVQQSAWGDRSVHLVEKISYNKREYNLKVRLFNNDPKPPCQMFVELPYHEPECL